MSYSFKEDIYPSEISYVNHYSVFSFFSNKVQVEEFFKYLFARIENDFKLKKKGKGGFAHLVRNDNDRAVLIDINYNFVIEVLADWIEHYSVNKIVETEYKKYRRITDKENAKEEDVSKSLVRNLKIDFTIKERVLFDYSYCGWMILNNFHKKLRFSLWQVFFNNVLGKFTYVPGYQNYKRSRVVASALLKNLSNDEYYKLGLLSFNRAVLVKLLGKRKMEKLHKMAEEYEKIVTTDKAIKNRLEKLEIDSENVNYYIPFDVKKIEKERDKEDGEWHYFTKSKDEEYDESEEE